MARRAFRVMLRALKRFGVDSTTHRDRLSRPNGIRFQWRAEKDVLRGAVHEHEIDGQPVRFFVADGDDALQFDHVLGRWYEPRELAYIRSVYRGGTFADVGAGLGNHSVFAGLVLGAPKIVAFEPMPITWHICITNLRLNDLGSRAIVHQVGLSDCDQMASVSRMRASNIGATALAPAADGTLELKRGDALLADEQLGFLKIDVEGHEMLVLDGLAETISRQRPPILIEVDHLNRSAFDDWLREASYEIRGEVRRSANTNFLLRACG